MAVDPPVQVQANSVKFAIGMLSLPYFIAIVHGHLADILADRGGTFTDVWASVPGRPDIVLKLLSVDPGNYDDAPAEGIRRVLEMVSGQSIPRGSPIPKGLIHSIRMGTTVATNGETPIYYVLI